MHHQQLQLAQSGRSVLGMYIKHRITTLSKSSSTSQWAKRNNSSSLLNTPCWTWKTKNGNTNMRESYGSGVATGHKGGSATGVYDIKEEAKELSFCCPEKEIIKRRFNCNYHNWEGAHREDGDRLFPDVHCEKTRVNSHKLQQEKLRSKMRENNSSQYEWLNIWTSCLAKWKCPLLGDFPNSASHTAEIKHWTS